MMVILGSIRKSLQASVRNAELGNRHVIRKLGILFNKGNSKKVLWLINGEDFDDKARLVPRPA